MSEIPDDVIKAMELAAMDHWGYLSDDGIWLALAAAEAKGWKLVPRKPTPEMTGAMCQPAITTPWAD